MNECEQKLFGMYQQKKLGKNAVCKSCGKVDGPVSFWHVGKDYESDPCRLLIVGKTARGTPGTKMKTGILDARGSADELYNESWPFWSYIRAVLERVYGNAENGWKHVALTNLLKCNNSENTDQATDRMQVNCLEKMRVFQAEVEILAPRLIIFLTGRKYDDCLARLCFGGSHTDHEDDFVRNGGGTMCWWDREFTLDGKPVLRFLRTGHPERKNKKDFVRLVAAWTQKARKRLF